MKHIYLLLPNRCDFTLNNIDNHNSIVKALILYYSSKHKIH